MNLLKASIIATALFWIAFGGMKLYQRHQIKKWVATCDQRELECGLVNLKVDECKLQLDHGKPNYNDCGALVEPISPTTGYDQPPKEVKQ